MKFCNIFISKELHTIFKKVCSNKGLKMNRLVEGLIIAWLEDQAKDGK